MKLRSKPDFLELAAQLLQRAMDEGHPDLVLKWGEAVFQSLSRSAFIISIIVYQGLNHALAFIHCFELKVSKFFSLFFF